MKKIIFIIFSLLLLALLTALISPYPFKSPDQGVILDRTGQVVVGHKQQQRSSFDEVPEYVRELVVGIEDRRFWSHPGIDPVAVGRAIWLRVQGVRPIQGASTIDQQVIKLDREQFSRNRRAKVQENRWALTLQLHHSKEEILLRYVNTIPFSHQIVGWKAACAAYWGKDCAFLSQEEVLITLVIGQLGANPYREAGWKQVLGRAQMLARVTPEVFSGNLILTDALADRLLSFPAPLDPRVAEVVRATNSGGVSSYDLALSERIDGILERTATQRTQYAIQDCCVVVLDAQGGLVSMNLCRDREDPQGGKVNSCLVPRQTGSAIKPFLYAFAFHMLGLGPNDTVLDESVTFDLGGGSAYDPKNFDLTYHGEVSRAYALGNSLNIPAVKLLHRVGVAPFLDFLKKQFARVDPKGPLNPKSADEVGLSLALGTYEMSPYQFAQLWRTLLPGIGEGSMDAARRDVVSILRDGNNKIVSFGQDTFLNQPGWAVKTGTSRKFVDGRICGVTQQSGGRVICIWLGNQTNEPMLGASSEVGSYLWSLVISN